MKKRIYLSEGGSNHESMKLILLVYITEFIDSGNKIRAKKSIRSHAENLHQRKSKNIFKIVKKKNENGSINSDKAYNTIGRRFGSKILNSNKGSMKESFGGSTNNHGRINLFSMKGKNTDKRNIL